MLDHHQFALHMCAWQQHQAQYKAEDGGRRSSGERRRAVVVQGGGGRRGDGKWAHTQLNTGLNSEAPAMVVQRQRTSGVRLEQWKVSKTPGEGKGEETTAGKR